LTVLKLISINADNQLDFCTIAYKEAFHLTFGNGLNDERLESEHNKNA
jgi:hypothetical protein